MAGDDIDPFEIKGNLSLISSVDPAEFGDGSIDVEGKVNTDYIGENVLGNGLTMNDVKYMTIKEHGAPSAPVSGGHIFYVDTSDSLLKSKDTGSNVQVYQPLTTKGDIMTHNNATSIRLPVGIDGQILISDSSNSSGLKWSNNVNVDSDNINLAIIGSSKYVEIQDVLYGAYYNKIYNKIDKGPSANFFYSKSKQSIDGGIVRKNSCPGFGTNKQLKSQWIKNEEPEVSKNTTEYDGNYMNKFSTLSTSLTNVTLSGTAYTTLISDLTGNFLLTITNDIEGPVGTFFVTKNIATTNGGSIVRISNSPGTSSNRLRLRWLSSAALEIKKTNNNDDGIYKYINLLSLAQMSTTVTLSGTTSTEINVDKYQRVTGVISVKTQVINGPTAIFSFSKNEKTVDFNYTRVASSPGDTTSEQLKIEWNANEKIKLYKTGINYDGNYDIEFLM